VASTTSQRLNRRGLRLACGRTYMGGMQNRDYWTQALREAERELEAAGLPVPGPFKRADVPDLTACIGG
jgi:hypothetical protein